MKMFSLLFLIYIAHSAPLQTCTIIPPGSIWPQPQNNLSYQFVAPSIAGTCQTESDGKSTHSQMFNCSGSTAFYLRFDGKFNCDGVPDIVNPVTVNGTCTTMACGAYDSLIYVDSECSKTIVQNVTNQYVYWQPNVCHGAQPNNFQSRMNKCANGYPQYMVWENNTNCAGEPTGTYIASGKCVKGVQVNSYKATLKEANPCA
eukprot:542225_1